MARTPKGAMTDPQRAGEPVLPEVMFLPLAAAAADGWHGLDPGVLARRIPDFVHQVLNRGQVGPTGMLEVQTPPEEGPVAWVLMEEAPEPDEAFELLPEEDVRAVVTGEVKPVHDGLFVEFFVYAAEDAEASFTSKIGGVIPVQDPVTPLLRLVRRLARLLELPFHEPPRGLLTRSGPAFFKFLHGLDNAMLLSGDLQIEVQGDRESLMQPFTDALTLDPKFGLSLRVAHSTAAMALEGARLDKESVRRFLDSCYSVQPVDGEGCVAVAEQLTEMGEDERAIAWLEHASNLDPPPARGLESLGIIFANRGETIAARELWLKGATTDGHPDFFAHLARLHFSEQRELDAWDMVLRGLRKLYERTTRAGEWDDQDRGGGVLLHYLHEHLNDHEAPADLIEALVDLKGLLDGEDQIHLGLCLLACERHPDARRELVAGLQANDVDLETRDQAVRALLNLDVTGFEKKFAKAADVALRSRNPKTCLGDFQVWLQLQPEFWPALFFSAIAKQRLGAGDEALDLFAAALELSPGQPDVLHRQAVLFDDRGNSKRALELVDEALESRGDDPKLLAAKVQFLVRLGRDAAAREVLQKGLSIAATDRDLQRIRRLLD